MSIIDIIVSILLIIGALFFMAGTLGLLRFPDVFTRLHALTKADNVGLGLIVFGLALQSGSWAIAAKLFLIWILVMMSGSSIAYLIARNSLKRNVAIWKQKP